MEVPEDDLTWMVNVRKALANTFRSIALEGNFRTKSEAAKMFISVGGTPVLQVYEDTIGGTCEAQ